MCFLRQVPVRTLVINQIVQESATQRFLDVRRKDRQRALDMLRSDSNLRSHPLSLPSSSPASIQHCLAPLAALLEHTYLSMGMCAPSQQFESRPSHVLQGRCECLVLVDRRILHNCSSSIMCCQWSKRWKRPSCFLQHKSCAARLAFQPVTRFLGMFVMSDKRCSQ